MNYFRLSLRMLFHPLESFTDIKRHRKTAKIAAGIGIVLLLILVRFAYLFTVHYPMETLRLRDASVWLEIGKILLPLLIFTASNFAVTSILGGESTLKEIFLSTAYCTMPYLLFTLPLSLLSQALSLGEQGLYTGLQNLLLLWIGFLLILSIKTLNNYTLGQTVGIGLLILFCMAVVCAILVLFVSLFNNLWTFVTGLFTEVRMSVTG